MEKAKFIEKIKILDDNTRVTILELLSQNGTLCGCRLLEELNITQGTLSHHMKLLVENEFVTCKKEAKWCHYTINKNTMEEISNYIKELAK